MVLTPKEKSLLAQRKLATLLRLEKHYRCVWGLTPRAAFLGAWAQARKEK